MIQLTLLNGEAAGSKYQTRRFPVSLGRSSDAHLCLSEKGVWQQHAEIHLENSSDFALKILDKAIASVNGAPVVQAVLRNGDIIQLGAAQLRFNLSPVVSRSLKWRERLTWTGLFAVFLVQIALIYLLLI